MDFRVFSATKLHAALSARGDGPSFRTVRRWVEGKAIPSKADERIVLAVIHAQQKATAPDWAVALSRKVDDLLASQSKVANEAVESIKQALSNDENEKVELMRRAVALALKQSAPNERRGRGPRVVKDEDGEPEGSPPPPTSSSAAPDS